MNAAAPVDLISPVPYNRHLKVMPAVQKGLKIALTACSILSLVPPLRLAGNLATRGIALISSSINGAETWKSDHLIEKIAECSKIALVILGIVAVAVSLPVLSIASIAADLAYNTFELGRAIYHKDLDKALTHMSAIVIDTFALAAIATGFWQLMVVAASLSAAAMLAFGIKVAVQAVENDKPLDTIDAVCNFLQAGVGIASAVMISKIESTNPSNTRRYVFKNPYDKEVQIHTRDGVYIMTVAPGETVEFEYTRYRVYELKIKCLDSAYPDLTIAPEPMEIITDLVQAPIDAEDLNKLPVDSTVCPLLQSPALEEKVNPHLQEIEAFSNPVLGDPIPCAMQAEGAHIQLHFPNSKQKIFHYESLKKQIPSIDLFTKSKENMDEKYCHLNDLIDKVSIDERFEEVLIHYLMTGDLKNMDNLSENKILELFYFANGLMIERLRALTLKSIADRLKRREWKNIDLLREIKRGQELSPLQNLLNYYSF